MAVIIRATAVAAGLIVAAMGTAGLASAAAAGPVDAATTIQSLQGSGYRVILIKVGSEPLSTCHVTSIHPGKPVTETVPAGGGDTMQEVLYTPVFVSVAPSHRRW